MWNSKPARTCLLKNNIKSGQVISGINAFWVFTYPSPGLKCLLYVALWCQAWQFTNYPSHTPLHLASCKLVQMADKWKVGGGEKKPSPVIPDPVGTNPVEETS